MESTKIRNMYEKSGRHKNIPALVKSNSVSPQDLKISAGECIHTIDDILSALDILKIDANSRKEIQAFAHSFEDKIIGVKIRLKISVSLPNS